MKSPKFASCDKGDLIRGNAAGDGCVYVVPVVSICGGGALFDTGDFGVMYCGDTILPLYCAEGAEHEVAVVVEPCCCVSRGLGLYNGCCCCSSWFWLLVANFFSEEAPFDLLSNFFGEESRLLKDILRRK